jgi:hypothetical protein
MENATKEDVENLCKKVHELTELAKQKSENYEESVKKMMTEVLKNHPGMAGERKIQFPVAGGAQGIASLLDTMPKEMQDENDNLFILAGVLGRKPTELKRWESYFKPKFGEFKKALDTAGAGEGLEWVPTGFSSQLYELVRLKTTVSSLFPQIIMPTNPYKLPVQVGRLTSFKQPEQTADTSQTTIPFSDTAALTGNVTLTAVGHAAYVLVSKDAEEDSLIPMLPFLRAEIIRALADGRDDCILNGDITGSHQDSDVSSASSRRKMWSGLRKLAIANGYTSDLSELTPSNITTLTRGSMGKYGINPADLVLITGMKGYINLLNVPQVTTVDKYGPGATIVTGELAKFMGMPILVSEWIREDLNASGVYASGATKSVMHVVNKNSFVMGVRREASVQLLIEKYADSDQDALKTRERVIWAPVYPVATEKTTWMGINIG